jgi:hypothetical protein
MAELCCCVTNGHHRDRGGVGGTRTPRPPLHLYHEPLKETITKQQYSAPRHPLLRSYLIRIGLLRTDDGDGGKATPGENIKQRNTNTLTRRWMAFCGDHYKTIPHAAHRREHGSSHFHVKVTGVGGELAKEYVPGVRGVPAVLH